jgi:cell division septation protein DedD
VPQERRLTTRKTLERLTYIDLPSHNGGIVTDVSEGGLGFHAVAPVENTGPIHFSFTGGSQPIAGLGELMWTDEKGKIGGLRFTELAEEIREQIRNWPLESNLQFRAGKATAPEAPAATGSLAAASTAQATAPAQGAPAESAAQASKGFAFSSYAPYFPETLSPESPFGKRSSRLLKTIGICSLAGVIAVASYLGYREARQWLAASKESGGAQTSQGLAAVPAPNAPSESSGIVPVNNPNGNGSEAASAPAQSARQSAASAAPASAAPGTSQAHDATPPGPQAVAESQAPPAEDEILFVQVAAYTNEADALNLVYSLRGQHFIAFVSPPVTDAYYRVQLGPYTSLEAAQIGKRELEKVGFKPFIRH